MSPFRFPLLAVSLLLCFSEPFSAQQPTAAAPQRDPQAILVVSQMLSATGWITSKTPADALLSGVLTLDPGNTTEEATFTAKLRGPTQAVYEIQGTSSSTTVLNGTLGTITNASGNHYIAANALFSMRPFVLPFWAGLGGAQDATANLTYVGLETINGQSVNHVEIHWTATSNDLTAALQSRASYISLWISAATGLPVQVQYPRVSNENPNASRTITRTYSDYRQVDGLSIPYHQEESANGQTLSVLDLSSVSFNVGLTDADFAPNFPADGEN